MEFGICLNVVDVLRESPSILEEQLAVIAAAGFSYVEINVTSYAGASDAEINTIMETLIKSNISAKRACVLFPGDLKVVGPKKNDNTIRDYLGNILPKLKAIGVEIIVFGSGGARSIPDGFPYSEAFSQFCDTARLTASMAAESNIKVALEHLNPGECNLLITVEETIKAVREVNLPNCGLLFDFYHIDEGTDDILNVLKAKDILIHSHVAQPGSRLYPVPESSESLQTYFTILKDADYKGAVSVEATLNSEKSFEENMTDAYKVLIENLI